MSLIKSALEIAMEKSQDLKVDKDELQRQELYKKARALGGQALLDSDGPDKLAQSLQEKKKELDRKSLEIFRQGVLESLLNRISLSLNVEDPTEIERLFLSLDHTCSRKVSPMRSPLEQLLKQYQEEILGLRDAIEAQLGPRLRQRAEQMAMQTGQRANYSPERDPDFIRIFNQNLEQLKEHYQKSLDQIKADITQSL